MVYNQEDRRWDIPSVIIIEGKKIYVLRQESLKYKLPSVKIIHRLERKYEFQISELTTNVLWCVLSDRKKPQNTGMEDGV